jgi:YHS domain-containing protein
MCVERIPKDKKVREAVDPYTGKAVDKASAYIVMISNEGEVAYFENEENYKKFLAQNS